MISIEFVNSDLKVFAVFKCYFLIYRIISEFIAFQLKIMSEVITQLHILNLLQGGHSYRPDFLKFFKYIKNHFLFSFLKQKK